MSKVTLSDLSKTLCEMQFERESLRAEAESVTARMVQLHQEFMQKINQCNQHHQAILQKMAALDDTTRQLLFYKGEQ